MRNRLQILSRLALPAAALVLSACAVDSTFSMKNSQISQLDASASMRVEVYKGPLSKEPAIQVAELHAIVEDADRALDIMVGNMNVSSIRLRCTPRAFNLNEKTSADESNMEGSNNSSQRTKISHEDSNPPVGKTTSKGSENIDDLVISRRNKKFAGTSFRIKVPYENPSNQTYIYCNTLRQILRDAVAGWLVSGKLSELSSMVELLIKEVKSKMAGLEADLDEDGINANKEKGSRRSNC